MSVAAAYFAQEFAVCELAESRHPDLMRTLAFILLGMTLVDSRTVKPESLWNVAVAQGLVDEDEDADMDCDTINHNILSAVNEIMARRECDVWVNTLCSQRPRIQQNPLWKRLIFALLKHTPAAHPRLRGPDVLEFMEQLTLAAVPDAKHYETFAYIVNLLGKDCDPELRQLYTQFVHTHFVRTCQSIHAALCLRV